jgi:nucleotide-binding universal stress UspA family protein
MKVLVAIDDSKFSEAALKAVASQYRPTETQVRVVHVLQPIAVSTPPQMSPDYTPELRDQAKEADKLVQKAAQSLRTKGFQVDTEIDKGDIRERILDAAQNWHADLILLGSHGRGGLSRLLLGSVAESVARHAPCSVEVVRVQ